MTRLAVLIDADNAQASLATELLEEIARYGTATVKRAYGDWTTDHLKVALTTASCVSCVWLHLYVVRFWPKAAVAKNHVFSIRRSTADASGIKLQS